MITPRRDSACRLERQPFNDAVCKCVARIRLSFVSTKVEAVSSDRRNTSAMMSALSAEVMGWVIESITGTG